ncbi:MAG: transposase [Acidobacteriota bacterium]
MPKPWNHCSWVFPRDPQFREKAARILDSYEGRWQRKPLAPGDCVLCADEKTSIQARRRRHTSRPPGPAPPMWVEHEYHQRRRAWAYLAAWEVRKARLFGRCEPKTGIEPFSPLVSQVMSQQPYRSAPRVFWVMDNGSSHRGQACIRRLQSRWTNLIVVHTPVHASWLNQIEIYFSVLTRKALKPNDFDSLDELKTRILSFQRHDQQVAKPFNRLRRRAGRQGVN